jgi:prepilin-type N-terminal cleavage/methylation domain-containing protein
MRRHGFTLMELLGVVAIILVLVGLTMPVMRQVRRSGEKAATAALVQNLQVAIGLYLGDQHVLPPTAAGGVLCTDLGTSGPRQTLDLLKDEGFDWQGVQLCPPGQATPRYLIDDFQRPVHYSADGIVGAAIVRDRPAPPALWPGDWNPRNLVPFAYVWSLGPPTGMGDASDADPNVNLSSWIYVHSTL